MNRVDRISGMTKPRLSRAFTGGYYFVTVFVGRKAFFKLKKGYSYVFFQPPWDDILLKQGSNQVGYDVAIDFSQSSFRFTQPPFRLQDCEKSIAVPSPGFERRPPFSHSYKGLQPYLYRIPLFLKKIFRFSLHFA